MVKTRPLVSLSILFLASAPLLAQSGASSGGTTLGSSSSGAAWNDPLNPPPSMLYCPTCPPTFVNSDSEDGGFGAGLGGPIPGPGGNLPSAPGEGTPGIPTTPFTPGGCVFIHCWSVEDVPATGVPGGYVDKLVESFAGTGPCGTGNLPFNPDCYQLATPCIGTSQTGECTLEALKKMAEDHPELPVDPNNPNGPKWKDYGDQDNDGIPNIIDLYPQGAIGFGPINPGAYLPSDPDKLKLLLKEIGSNPALIDLLLTDPNWSPGLNYTAADLFTDIKLAIQSFHAQLGQDLAHVQSLINDLMIAGVSYQQQWQALVAAMNQFLANMETFSEMVGGFWAFASEFSNDFFGGSEAKENFLFILEAMHNDIAKYVANAGLKGALVQASEILTVMQENNLKVAVKIDGKDGPALQLLPNLPPALDSTLQHPEGSQVMTTSVEGPPNKGPEEKIPPLFPNQDLPLVASSTVGDPVDTWSGELLHRETDLSVPGRGLVFTVTRTYRSRAAGRGIFGPNWITPLEARLIVYPDSTTGQRFFVFEAGDGTQRGFRYNGAGNLWIEQSGGFGKIQADVAQTPWTPASEQATGGFVLREANGNFLYFCPPSIQFGDVPLGVCWLKKISDSYGNAIVFSRDALGRVREVTDTLGRKFQFQYNSDRLLNEITGPAGIKVVYEYDRADLAPPVTPAGGRGSVSVGGGQSSGTGAQNPGFGINPNAPIEYKKRDLIRATYWPAVPVLESSGQVAMKNRFHRYQYGQDPAGFVSKPDSALNHNLTSIESDNQGASVQFQYFTADPSSYEFDRVKSYTIAGKTTLYRYLPGSNAALDNPYGQSASHRTEVFFPQSEGSLGHVERFDHDAKGHLLRHEIRDGLYDANFALVNAPANGVGAFVTLMSYSDDWLLLEETRTSETGFAAGKKRVTQYLYDSSNFDRFQQGRLLQITALPDPTVPSDFPQLTRSFTYDPLSGGFATQTDALGRTTRYFYEYQESTMQAVSSWLGVQNWGINLTQTNFQLGDLNQDGQIGHRAFAMIRRESPSVEVALPTGPGGASMQTPAEIWKISNIGQALRHCAVDGVCEDSQFEGGMLARTSSTIDGNQIQSQFGYDALSRMTVMIGPDGGRIETVYDATGHTLESREISVDGQTAVVRQSFYDLAGRLAGESMPVYASQAPAYAAGMQANLATRNQFNAAGQQISQTIRIDTPLGTQSGTWNYGYDSRGRVETTTSPSASSGASIATLAVTTKIERDARGLTTKVFRTSVTNASLGLQVREYSAYGDLTRLIGPVDSDGNGSLDSAEAYFDGYGREIGGVSLLGVRSQLSLDAAGRVLHAQEFSSTNALLRSSHAAYDALDRVKEAVEENFETLSNGAVVALTPGELRTRWGYDIAGRVLWQLENPFGKAYLRRMEYDGMGRARAAFAGTSGELGVSVERDAAGRIVKVHRKHDLLAQTGTIDPSLTTNIYGYDGLGRLTSVKDPLNATTQFLELTAMGQPGRIVDARGNQRVMSYDSAGRPWQMTEIGVDSLTRTSRKEFDLLDLVASVDPKNQRTEYQYDDLRRLTKERYADQSEQRYTVYDFSDRLLQMQKPDGSLLVFQYNAAGQTTSVQANSAVASALSVTQQFFYDALGRMTRGDDRVGSGPTISIQRRYASSGLMLSQAHVSAEFSWNRSFGLDYDSSGAAQAVHHPSGFTTSYGYDAIGRWQTISSSSGTVATRTAAYGSSYKEVVLGNGAKIRQAHDARGLVLEREVQNLTQQTVFGERYAYDGNRNLVSRDRLQNGQLDRHESFSYDGFDRLSHWNYQGGGGALPREQDFQHDAGDNLVSFANSVNGSNQTQTGDYSNLMNFCESFAPFFPSIGFNGNGEESQYTIQGGAQVLLQWDALGRVAKAEKFAAGGVLELSIQYYWDTDHQLFARIDSAAQANFFERLGGEILGSLDSQKGHFDYARDPAGHAFYRSRGSEKLYFAHDLQGNPRATLANDGNGVLERYDFTPFGERFDPQNANASFASSPVDMEMSYLGLPQDRALGLHFLGARFYDSRMGRFLSRDPLGVEGSQSSNVYSYARRNPLRFHDRSGLSVAETQNPSSAGQSVWDWVCSSASSAWDFTKQEVVPRAFGALQVAGAVTEMTAGYALIAAGVATSEIGVGILGIVGGGAMVVHAGDNAWAGLKMLWSGQPQTTTTEMLLQKAGMSKTGASLTNGAIGGVATFLSSGGWTMLKQLFKMPPPTGPVLAGSSGTLGTALVGEGGQAATTLVKPALVGASETTAAITFPENWDGWAENRVRVVYDKAETDAVNELERLHSGWRDFNPTKNMVWRIEAKMDSQLTLNGKIKIHWEGQPKGSMIDITVEAEGLAAEEVVQALNKLKQSTTLSVSDIRSLTVTSQSQFLLFDVSRATKQVLGLPIANPTVGGDPGGAWSISFKFKP